MSYVNRALDLAITFVLSLFALSALAAVVLSVWMTVAVFRQRRQERAEQRSVVEAAEQLLRQDVK